MLRKKQAISSKRDTIKEPEEKRSDVIIIKQIRSSKLRRPYGLLAEAGINSHGMTPREAWETLNEYRKDLKDKKEPSAPKKENKRAPSVKASALTVGRVYREKVNSEQGYEDWEYTGNVTSGPNGKLYAFENDRGTQWFDEEDLKNFKLKKAKQEPSALKTTTDKHSAAKAKPTAKQPPKADKTTETKRKETEVVKPAITSKIKIPELSADLISQANANSHYDRGTGSERDYKAYANTILSMDISDNKKEKLLCDLKKRWDKLLGYQAAWVPWTVAGPARYNAKKLDKGDQVLNTRKEISDWFEGVERSIKNSKSQYKDDDRNRKAKREEEYFNMAVEKGWYSTPTSIANGLAAIAPHDPQRFVELYEQYSKKYKFRKNTTAAKLYEQTKAGKYKGAKKPEKLHETENLNTYKKTIQAGERVFMKFTTRPKPQLIYALKKRGWHWNANESAWSIDTKKYDEKFVKGIDENYKKYL